MRGWARRVVRLAVVAFQEVGDDDFRVVAGHRCQWGPHLCCISSRVVDGVRRALQVFVELESAFFHRDAGGVEVQRAERRHSAAA